MRKRRVNIGGVHRSRYMRPKAWDDALVDVDGTIFGITKGVWESLGIGDTDYWQSKVVFKMDDGRQFSLPIDMCEDI